MKSSKKSLIYPEPNITGAAGSHSDNPDVDQGGITRPTTHSFSRSFAREHGINEAILAGYLANRIVGTRKRQGEGYRCTLDELAAHYPYLSRSAIFEALKRLQDSEVLTVHHRNWKAWDRTAHYSFSTSALREAAQVDVIYFNVNEAVAHGIPAALLLTNFRMRLMDERSHERLERYYRISSRTLADHLPLTPSRISRAINELVAEGVIKVRRSAGFDRANELEVASVLGDVLIQDSCEAKSDLCAAKQDACDAEPHAHAARPDIFNTLEVDIGSERLKSGIESVDSYEARPASPPAGRDCSDQLPDPAVQYPVSFAEGVTGRAGLSLDEAVNGRDEKINQFNELNGPVSSIINEQDPFGSLLPFTPLQRETMPSGFEKLHSANIKLWPGDLQLQDSIIRLVEAKANAVMQRQGVGRMFRWLNIKHDDELFSRIKEAVERTRCDADSIIINGRAGVDWFLTDWLFQAMREYLNDNLQVDAGPGVNSVASLLVDHFKPYYQQNRATLQTEGLGHLRYGEDVREERLRSPDVKKQGDQHLSAAEKTRVFNNALIAINRVGNWKGQTRFHNIVTTTKTGLELARRFFELNNHWTAQNLLDVVDHCLFRIHWFSDEGGFLKDFAVTKGNHLTFLMRYLETIIQQAGPSLVPAANFPADWTMK